MRPRVLPGVLAIAALVAAAPAAPPVPVPSSPPYDELLPPLAQTTTDAASEWLRLSMR